MHAIVWKIRVILLQIFVWIVDLKVRERLTEYLKKDIKYHQVNIGMHMSGICYRSRRKLKNVHKEICCYFKDLIYKIKY